jgi:spore coat protein U-like protein
MKRALLGFLFVGLVLGAAPAYAGSAPSDFTVTANVVAACTISTTGISFGNYDATSLVPKDASGSVTVACALGTAANVRMGQGANAATGSTDAAPLRQMATGTDRLRYDLYQDATHLVAWANTAGTGQAYVGLGPLGGTTLTIYGRVPINQNAPVANGYSDTVTASVNF